MSSRIGRLLRRRRGGVLGTIDPFARAIPPRIGLGLAALGRPAYIDAGRERDLGDDRSRAAMETRCREVLDAAYGAGIRYFDVARSYGDAEAFVGRWLADRRPDDVAVGSKWGYTYVGDWRMDADVQELKDLSLATLRRQAIESCLQLGRRPFPYQIHSATVESGVFEDRMVIRELARMRENGWELGFTTSGPRQADAIRRGVEIEIDGERLFSSVQSTWNVLEPSAGPALSEARSRGCAVLIKEALANGRLAAEDGPLASIAARLEVTPDRVALAAAVHQFWVDIVLSGAVTTEQVQSNAAALDLSPTPDDLAELGGLAQPAERYWAERAQLPWS
jgi:aryl-alcohol dehydrogenase-like predicted oxidoreductase